MIFGFWVPHWLPEPLRPAKNNTVMAESDRDQQGPAQNS